ncbi:MULTISPECIES: hypothetical protein [unclassified Sphingomonas]|uniref:hypothetical protein n=1 Tax=unclassified Sphingomonas TaxID=196159 RepID=UPI000F745DFE|nr:MULTISPECIES: hypothetical protein [unclassified Sphingomonas]
MIRALCLATLVPLAMAGCTGSPATPQMTAAAAAGLDKELAGLTPHGTTSCINLYGMQQTHGYGPTIVYVASQRLKYRSDTTGGCEGIGRGDVLVTRTPSTQLCQGDIATTVDAASRSFTGSCAFGPFTKYSDR